MMSLEKVAANRRNAQRSTGPCTPEGKRISRRNALKHGILSREVLLASERAGELASGSDNLRRRWMTRATSEAKDWRTRPRQPPPPGRTSLRREAAVGDDLGARHIRRLVRGEEQRDVRNLPRVCDRPRGIPSSNAFRLAGSFRCGACIGVSMIPGWMMLQRTFWRANWMASDLVSEMSASLELVYESCASVKPHSAETDPTLMTDPPPARIRCGMPGLTTNKGPFKLIAWTRSQSASSVSSTDRSRSFQSTPALL